MTTTVAAKTCTEHAVGQAIEGRFRRASRISLRLRAVEKLSKTYNTSEILYASQREYHDPQIHAAMTFAEAGAALRRWRERHKLRLEDIASRTGLDVTQLSYIERGMRKPQRKTLDKLESGMGWPPGSFHELSTISGDPAALDQLLDRANEGPQSARTISLRVSEAGVLEDYAQTSIANVDSLIRALPAPGAHHLSRAVATALGQCGKAEVLAANSWRVSAIAERGTAQRLLDMLSDLENKRLALLDRVPDSVAARFDRACQLSGYPEGIIAVLTGLSLDDIWQIRCGAAVPEGSNARVAAFIKAVNDGS